MLRIVGLGASAGGLLALEKFFGQVPLDSGLAFVVVQHINPNEKALLVELLQKATSLPVCEAQHEMRMQANAVYVIAPDTELSVDAGRLLAVEPIKSRGLRLPIDVLFSSLAKSYGKFATGVVLSGMGSDGTLGLEAIRAVGGVTIAQDPSTAQFDSMPTSAIATQCVDFIAAPQDIPAYIMNNKSASTNSDVEAVAGFEAAIDASSLAPILQLLLNATGHDFSLYKPNTLQRRVARRMAIHNIDTVDHYAEFLRQNRNEIDLLFKELLIGVTSFFRDAAVWEYLQRIALPILLKQCVVRSQLRAWVVGCSTGEEAYSLAIVLTELLEQLYPKNKINVQIFASDLSQDAIAIARRGRYATSIANDVSNQRLARFFTCNDSYCQISPEIRDMIVFAEHDVALDAPFTKIDLITCRNLLIYFDTALQRKLLPMFHYSLTPEGLLLLGGSETVGRASHLFLAIEPKLRVYKRQESSSLNRMSYLMAAVPPVSKLVKDSTVLHPAPPGQANDNLQAAVDYLLLQVFSPAAVVVNADGDIIYISGRTGKYLEPAAGKANWNFHAMVNECLRDPLMRAFKKALAQAEPVVASGVELSLPTGELQVVDMTVQSLSEPSVLCGLILIVFKDVAKIVRRRRTKIDADLDSSRYLELQRCRAEIQRLQEESRTTREELQSANEELQSTNEELQSTNEELTTSKEEMQSMNEELQTINAEMQSKLDDLSLAQSDMQNLLNSIEIAILFLDQHMNVRRFTERTSQLINVRESDIGRPFSDITTNFNYPELYDDAANTLRTLLVSEKRIQSTDQKRWFSVRVMPYRRLDNLIDGVVITFFDITASCPALPTSSKGSD